MNINNENGHENEVIEEIIDVMPTFNGLLNTLRDLYLVSYPRVMKSYTSFSFSDKSTLVMKKDDMHTMSSTAFVRGTDGMISKSTAYRIIQNISKDDVEDLQILRCITLLSTC